MAKTPNAPPAAPVLDDAVDLPAEGEAAPRRFRLRLPKIVLRLPAFMRKLPLPRIALPNKLVIIGVGGVLALAGAGAAAYAFWPAEAEHAQKPVLAKKAKSKRPKHAASAALVAMPAASAASQADTVQAAASAPAEAAAASGPEVPMDRLQRRLAEVMGGSSQLQADGHGELRLTHRSADAAASAPAQVGTRAPTASKRALADAAGDEHAAPHAKSAAVSAPVHWSYEGAGGPEAWGRLKPEYAKCTSGTRQSPIDLRDGIQVKLDAVKFEYQVSRFGVIDNGHTVQVNVAAGNFIEVMGRRFELQQFHFHRPSEERIDGKQFDMVAHLVHKDAEGRLAVVAVLLERGSAQAIVQAVWNNLPLEKGEEQAAQVSIDLNQLLPDERGYFTYMGSLTTPPCSEGVLWMVMKKPVPISPEQLAIFARMYPMNARPVQSASGRMVKESH